MKTWDDVDFVATSFFDVDFFKQHIDINASILDIGCGYGRIILELEKCGYKNIIGIDNSSKLLEKAAKIVQNAKLLLMDAQEIDFDDESFNCLITFGLIDCILDLNKLDCFIKKCISILRPNGYWFLNFYTRNSNDYFESKYRDGFMKLNIVRAFESNSGFSFRHHTLREIIPMIDDSMDIIKYQQLPFMSFNHNKNVNGASVILQKTNFTSEFR